RREEDPLIRLAARPTSHDGREVQGEGTDGSRVEGELRSAVAGDPRRVEAVPCCIRLIPRLRHLVDGLRAPVVRDRQPEARVHDPRAGGNLTRFRADDRGELDQALTNSSGFVASAPVAANRIDQQYIVRSEIRFRTAVGDVKIVRLAE